MTHPHAVRSLLFVNVCLAAAKGPCEHPQDLGKAALPPAASGGQGTEAGMLLGSGCLPATSISSHWSPKWDLHGHEAAITGALRFSIAI